MKKSIELYFSYGSASCKPSCRAIDRESGEVLASVTRDNWAEAEKAALKDTEKHFTYGPIPKSKIIELEVEDSWPDNVVNLTEAVEKGK